MAGLSIYDRFFLFWDGQPEVEASGFTVKFNGQPIPVVTLFKELAGFTPTPKSITIDVDAFMSSAGFTVGVDIVKKFLGNQFLKGRLQSGGSGKLINTEGMLMEVTLGTSAVEATKLAYQYMGTAAPLE